MRQDKWGLKKSKNLRLARKKNCIKIKMKHKNAGAGDKG